MLLTRRQIKILLLIAIIFLGIAYLGEPSKGPIFPCIFNKITGLFCPGCGMTRAINSMMHFNLYQVIRYNSLIVVVPPLMGIYLFLNYKGVDRGDKVIIYIVLAMTILYGIARNFAIFKYLQPIAI